MKSKRNETENRSPVGVGLRPVHFPHFLGASPPESVSWVEVITENFLPWKTGLQGKSLLNLERIRERYPVALHGVSLNLGSASRLDSAYLSVWKELIDRIEPIRVSDHLCWTGVVGRNSHDLLPLSYTRESLSLISDKILRVQDWIKRPLVIENVSAYVTWDSSEMEEGNFLRELVEKTGCGLLLDLNNINVSENNRIGNARAFLDEIPVESVEQIHLAGPSLREDGFWVDTHDSEVREEVWALFRDWTKRRPRPVPVMIERDGNIPEWPVLEGELLRIPREERSALVAL